MGAGGAAGGADLGDGLAGKDVGADLQFWFADEVAVTDGEVTMLQLYIIAGTGVRADGENFSGEHGVDWCAGLGREVESAVMLMSGFAEGISARAKSRGDFQRAFQRRVAPSLCRGRRCDCFPII